MKIACYKDNHRKRQVRYVANEEEYKKYRLAEAKYQTLVNEEDKTIILKRDQYAGSVWRRDGSEFILQNRVPTKMPTFGMMIIPETELGNPGDEVVAMITTSKLNMKEVRVVKPHGTNGSTQSKIVSVPAQAPVVNAKILRKVHELLGDNFDETRGKYTNGYSDERVAKEAECSIVFVQKQRGEAYGELAPEIDNRLKQIAFAMQGVRNDIRVSLDRFEALEKQVEALYQEQLKGKK